MTFLRLFLVFSFAVLAIYTVLVGINHGWNLIPPFVAEITAVNWQGQFNLDFLLYLLLSAAWCVWRNRFTPLGWGLAVFCALGGMLFFAAYLMTLSFKAGGDLRVVLLGDRLPT